jgi:hypothetical protein
VAGLAFTLLLGACGPEMDEGLAPDEEVGELVQEAVDGVESAADLEAVDGERAAEVVDLDPGRLPLNDGDPNISALADGAEEAIESSSSALIDEPVELPVLTEEEKAELAQALAAESDELPSDQEIATVLNAVEAEAKEDAADISLQLGERAGDLPRLGERAGGPSTNRPAPERGAAVNRLQFVTHGIVTPLDNFWNMRKDRRYRTGAYAWVIWTTDRCSMPHTWRVPSTVVIKKLMDKVWYKACTQHDFGYRNFRKVRGVTSMKKIPKQKSLTDRRFLDGMNWTCDKTFDRGWEKPAKAACRKSAVVVYGMVKKYGT